jgi:hypothetical protein
LATVLTFQMPVAIFQKKPWIQAYAWAGDFGSCGALMVCYG